MTDNIIRKPAIKIVQGAHTLYATTFTIADFQRDSLYRVNQLDTDSSEGYQRFLDEKRAKALGKDLSRAAKHDEAFLPTSILLATKGEVEYDDAAREISFSTASSSLVCPFLVVDGQHRIEGLRQFAAENPGKSVFPVAVNIITGMSMPQQMLQFLIVNAKQRAVNPALQQHIIKQFTEMLDGEIPYLPDWVARATGKRTDKLAIDIASHLIKHNPWQGKVRRADDEKKAPGHTINEISLNRSIKEHVLSDNNPLSDEEPEIRNKILVNYWLAIESVFVAPEAGAENVDTVVYKSIGTKFFHLVSAVVIERCNNLQDYRVEAIKDIFQRARERMADQQYMYPAWWIAGAGASGMNNLAITQKSSQLSKTIRSLPIVSGGEIKI
ncbi:MAG: DGQHR domain-containing protein [Gammaproteobacteria bacterium]